MRNGHKNIIINNYYGKINKLKVGDCIVFNDEFPCKVTKINKSNPGKRGSCKYSLFGKSLLTSKTYNMVMTHHDKPSYVNISKDACFGYYVDSKNYCDLTLDDDTGDKTSSIKLSDKMAKNRKVI